MNYYAYSFIKASYSRITTLSVNPLFQIKHHFNDIGFISLSPKEILNLGDISEYYVRFSDIENLTKIMSLYEFDKFIDESIGLVNWIKNKNIYYKIFYSIDSNCEEFTLYFRLKDLKILLEFIIKNFDFSFYQAVSSIDKILFPFGKRSNDAFFLKIKYLKDGSKKICIVPCITHENTISFESIVEVITNTWGIQLNNESLINLEKMYCLKRSIEYCINLQNGSVENIYFLG